MILRFLKSVYCNVKTALSRTHTIVDNRIRSILKGTIDENTIEELEEALYEADLGVETVTELIETVRKKAKKDPTISGKNIIDSIKEELLRILSINTDNSIHEGAPTIVLIVGVNGSGKTTFAAKLANAYKSMGKKVLLGAADTFRAAAIKQLELWANKISVDIVKGQPGSDTAAVAYDTVEAAQARSADIAIIDTAGRLHAKTDLMRELEKIRKTCKKLVADAPHETLLVLDATTGQNAINQAETFNKFTPITGLVLTKLDGTAKGGIAIAIQRKLGIPIKFIGTGEGVDDIKPFDPEAFVNAMFK